MELSDLPEPAPHADSETDALAPSQPDRTEGTKAPPFMGPLGIQGPLSPDAIDNARHGTWVMNDYLDGWTLIGANGRPVMRADGSRVAFWFRDIDRLTREWTPADDDAPSTAKQRPGLAALDSGFDSDWDPAIGRSYRADVTKSARLLAYYFAQRTEPEEAVRRAVAMVLDDPVMVKEGTVDAFVPKRLDLAAVMAVAEAMRTDLLGVESASAKLPESNAQLDNVSNDEGSAFQDEPLGGSSFADIVDAWLGDTLPSVVSALNGEDPEDVRVQLHDVADRLKPFTRAIVEQHTAITSGKLEAEKLLGPMKALLNLIRDPEGAAVIMALATRQKTSQINRTISAKDRRAFWLQEAKKNPKDYNPEDLKLMEQGKAAIGSDGQPMELHHADGTHEGGIKR